MASSGKWESTRRPDPFFKRENPSVNREFLPNASQKRRRAGHARAPTADVPVTRPSTATVPRVLLCASPRSGATHNQLFGEPTAMSDTEEDRCWICLGTEGDVPPLAHSRDAGHLVRVCTCSLRAHKRCLLDWATDIDARRRREGRLEDVLHQNELIHLAVHHEDRAAVVGLRATGGARIFTGSEIQCPQCKRQIMLKMKPSSMLSLHRIVNTVGKNVATTAVTTLVGTTLTASIAVTVFSLLSSVGYKMWSSLTGDTLMLTLMDIKERTFEAALRSDSMTLRGLFQLSGFPILIHCLRSGGVFGTYFKTAWFVTSYIDNLNYFPKRFLLYFDVAGRFYRILRMALVNPFYYRWLMETKPCFIADRLSASELTQLEEDYRKVQELETQRESISTDQSETPDSSILEKRLRDDIRRRETAACGRYDYSQVFHKKSGIWRFVNSCLWPFGGTLAGDLLDKYTPLNSYILPYIDTPAEQSYVRNLIGMGVIAVLRDTWLLYAAWKEVQQYKELDVIDSEFEGLKVDCMSSVHLEPGQELPNDLLEEHMRQHGPAAANEGGLIRPTEWIDSAWAMIPNFDQIATFVQ